MKHIPEEKLQKSLHINQKLVQEVQQRLLDMGNNLARDFSGTVEKGLKLWLQSPTIAEYLCLIENVLMDIDGMAERDIDEAKRAVDAIVRMLPVIKVKPKPTTTPPDTAENLREGLEHKEES